MVEFGCGKSDLCTRLGMGLLEGGGSDPLFEMCHFYRIDLPGNVAPLLPINSSMTVNNQAMDLTTFTSVQDIEGLNDALPTLFLFECVLMYLPPGVPETILTSCRRDVKENYVAIYDPIVEGKRGGKKFGEMMVQNLGRVGIAKGDLMKYCNEGAFEELLRVTAGDEGTPASPADRNKLVSGWRGTMDDAWKGFVGKEGRNKCKEVERLDEVEEFTMIMDRYFFVYV